MAVRPKKAVPSPPDLGPGTLHRVAARTLDIVLSLIGLVMAAPLFPAIAVLIKLDSKGPVFYLAERVGKNMKRFCMYKFRTMLESSTAIDGSICPLYDPRVTTVGRFLRRTKLNELPQLLNILKGEMSFVGPRPEAPDLMEMYPEDAKKVFSVKPGLVGPAVISSLKDNIYGRNEEEMYPPGVDTKQYYIQHIVPEKVKIDLFYLSRQTVGSYIKVIISAAVATVFGAFSARQVDHSKRQIYLFIADFALSQISYAFAYWVYVHAVGIDRSFKDFFSGLLILMLVRPVFFYAWGLYNFVMELITPRDVYRVSYAVGLGSLSLLAFNAFHGVRPYPPLLAVVDFCLLAGMLTGIRLSMLFHFRDQDKVLASDRKPRVVIYGANRRGLEALNTLSGSKNSPYKVVGFIDDAEEKYSKKIRGVKVLGNRHHIQALAVLYNFREMILAPDEEAQGRIDEIVALCARAGIRNRIFSADIEGETRGRISYPIRPLHLSDMLPQVKVQLDETVLRSILPGKTVLMLGSGGELGSSICRYIFQSGCRKIVILDRYESQLSDIQSELLSDLPGFQIVPVVLDSQDIDALNKVFSLHRPHIVIHAGMRKYIPVLMTSNEEVVKSNYVRTFNLAKVAAWHGCEYFLMISSIKASHGGNFISESLRVAEISLGRFFGRTPTRLIVTRVGNIIENRGGIVSWLNDQILERKPVRLPAETAKAFLLSKNAAARSILQALVTGSRISPGGLLLTSEPGICLGFQDVARKIAHFYGLSMGVDIAVSYGELPGVMIGDEPSAVLGIKPEISVLTADSLGSKPVMDRVSLMIENMISDDTRQFSDRDWFRRTEEIVSQYGPYLFSQNKDISIN